MIRAEEIPWGLKLGTKSDDLSWILRTMVGRTGSDFYSLPQQVAPV